MTHGARLQCPTAFAPVVLSGDGRPYPNAPRPAGAPDAAHQLTVLCDTALDALFVVDDQRRYRRVNSAAAELLGTTKNDVLRRRIENFTPPERLSTLDWLWDMLHREGQIEGSYEVLRPDGSRVLAEFRATSNFSPGKHLIAARRTRRRDALPTPGLATLTAREREVLQLAAEGHSTAGIAELLVLSPATVKKHFENAYEKLGVNGRVAAVAEALRHGLVR